MTSPTNGDNGRGRWLLAHPLIAMAIAMAGLEVLFIAVIGGGALVLKLLLPGLPGYSVTGLSHAFLITCLNAGDDDSRLHVQRGGANDFGGRDEVSHLTGKAANNTDGQARWLRVGGVYRYPAVSTSPPGRRWRA